MNSNRASPGRRTKARCRNSEFGIRNAGRPALSDFGFANFEFRISAHPPHPDARCWILDAGSTHPPGRTTPFVGASFRVRQRVVPKVDVVDETQRVWWRALNPPAAAICGRGRNSRAGRGPAIRTLAGGGASPWPEATRKDPPTTGHVLTETTMRRIEPEPRSGDTFLAWGVSPRNRVRKIKQAPEGRQMFCR